MDYTTPSTLQPPPRPTVVMWFKLYAGALVLLYLGLAAVSLVFFLMDPADLNMGRTEATIAGSILLGLGLVFTGASVIPLFAPPRPWSWVYSIVLICIGMTSACFLPFCIPLLIFWLKPEVKAYYGKQ